MRLKLVAEITEYEALVAHDPNKPVVLEIENLDYLPDLLIKARIAFKMTHKELAAFLKRTEEEVKAFENKNYHNASYLDFANAMDVFGIQVSDVNKFNAFIPDYYREELINMRRESNLEIGIDMRKAS